VQKDFEKRAYPTRSFCAKIRKELLKFLRTQPILRQVAVTATLLILLLGGAVVWSAAMTRRERADEVQAEAGTIATTATALLDEYFVSLDAMALMLGRHPAVRALDRSVCTPLFALILSEQPLLNNVLLRGADGRLVASAVEGPTAQPAAPSVVSQVLKTGRPAASQLAVGSITGRQTILLAYPVRDDTGSVVGVFGVSLNLRRLETIFANLSLPAGSTVTLVDRTGRVMARSQDSEKFIGTQFDVTPREPKDVPRTSLQTGLDGVERFHGNAVIDRGPWLLSVAIPRSEVLASLTPLWQRNLTIVALTNLSVLFLTLWISRVFARDLKRLRNAAQRIANGDLSPPDEHPVPNLELAQLQDAFVTMAARLRDTRDALDRQFEQERKMHETLQSLQRQVVRQERLAAVGLLVSGVAHELNNPLQAILGTVELLERQEDLRPAIRNEIAFVKTQSGRAREIIRNLSRFSNQQPGAPTLIDLRDVIGEIVQLRKNDLDNASIALDIEASSARKVYANFTEIEQVTLNFVINAQQAIEGAKPAKGHILIRLTDTGKKVRLEVSDNGPGVRLTDEPKLFQPFFTTKPVGKGTGLGLSVSYGIIDSYGGAIGYANNEWGGATFFFELPGADLQAPDLQTTNDRAPVSRGSVLPGV
jgi:C4-dicarboxylate-specific signal transduction histidine kinase